MVHRELDVEIADRTKPGLRLTRCALESAPVRGAAVAVAAALARVADMSPAVDDSYLTSGEDEEEGVADSTVASRSTRERLRIAAARYVAIARKTTVSFPSFRRMAFVSVGGVRRKGGVLLESLGPSGLSETVVVG